MQDLTYLKKPESGDTGSELFEALENDIEILDDHDHDGVTSEKLNTLSTVAYTISIDTNDWVAYNNIYKKIVNMPTGHNYSDYIIIIKDNSGDQIFCDIEDNDNNTSFIVYHMNNTTELTAYLLA